MAAPVDEGQSASLIQVVTRRDDNTINQIVFSVAARRSVVSQSEVEEQTRVVADGEAVSALVSVP
jgi:hypothetical protein